jgi:hypothetical protein
MIVFFNNGIKKAAGNRNYSLKQKWGELKHVFPPVAPDMPSLRFYIGIRKIQCIQSFAVFFAESYRKSVFPMEIQYSLNPFSF